MDVQEKITTQEQNVDNPHDKGYKRIFSVKKNFLDFIKKYISLDWMISLQEMILSWLIRNLLPINLRLMSQIWYIE